MKEANMLARSILWAAFAVLLPFEAALAQATNPTTVQKIALADVRTNVWGVADLNPDCSVVGPMTVKIRKEPRHGKVEIEDENGFVAYQSSNPRFHCNNIQVPMKKIYYTAEDNYDGNDKIELETFSSSGYSRKVFVDVTVKKWSLAVFGSGAPLPSFFAAWLIPAADAQTKLTSHDRTVLSDARTSVQSYYNLTPDCNLNGTITVRVLKQPAQGTLEIAHDRGFTNYAADNIRAKCNAQEVELTLIWYKSNADFKGHDQAQLEAFFTNGTSIKTTLQITVKWSGPFVVEVADRTVT